MRRKHLFLIAFCLLMLLHNVAFATVPEITFCGIPWLSNKDIVFQTIGIQDLITMDENEDDGSPIFIYGGKMSSYTTGEYTKTKRYDCLAYGTAPYGSYTFIIDNNCKAKGLHLFFLPMVKDGAVVEDEYQALFVKAMLQIDADDYSATYDYLVNSYTSYYGAPDHTEEINAKDNRREAYSVWYGDNGALFQIVLDTPRDDYMNLIMEYQKTGIEDLIVRDAAEEEPDDKASTSEKVVCGDYIYTVLNDGTVEIVQYTGKTSTLSIPDKLDGMPVTRIGYEAFKFCYSLTSVTIPDSVTSIGEKAFYGCYGLNSVTISNSVTEIGGYAFFDCSILDTAIVPDSVKYIGEGAFSVIGFDNLTALVFPNSNVTIIVRPDSYAEQYCIDNNLKHKVQTDD